MNSVSRKLTLGMIVALGAAACGDDVTVAEQTPPPAPTPIVRSVIVSPSAATIAVGGTFGFGSAVDADAPLATTVTWTSSNPAVATVNNAGVATGTAAGTTSVCATAAADATKSSCSQLTVAAAGVPRAVVVSPAAAQIFVGASFAFGASVDADAGIPSSVTWTSSNTAVATINASTGVVTAVTAGVSSICARSTVDANKSGCSQLTVSVAAPSAVSVTPSVIQIEVGKTQAFSAQVQAGAGIPTSVAWTSSNEAVATVTTAGVASAVSAGTTAICATSTADASKRSCAAVTVVAPPVIAPATISIDAITIGCDAIAAALAGANACSLTSPVATNNVFGEFQVRTNVNRPAGSTVTGVRLEVLDAATNIVEATQTQTLSAEPIVAEGLAAQTAANTVTFSVQSADYNTNTGVPSHVNGQKRVRVSLVGGTSTASADRELTFRNANGFHITVAAIPALNGAGVASTAPVAGRIFTGGVPLTFRALPVSYTNVAVNATTLAISFGSAACDLSGTGVRTAATTANTATFAYTSATTPAATSVNAYEFNPSAGCATANPFGEFPTANAVDANGNPFINIGLGGVFGANNTLNNPAGPVVPTGATAPGLRLDNRAPATTIVVNTNPNGRANNWLNDAVTFNTVGAAATNNMLLTGSTAVDAGVGGGALRARVGTTAALANASTDITNATTLAASATNATYAIVWYGTDTFMNRSAATGAATTFGVDRAAPTAAYTAGSIADGSRRSAANVAGEFIVTVSDTGLVGNSGMNPTTPMTATLTRRNNGATATPSPALVVSLPTISTTITAFNTGGYYSFAGTASDAAGNTTALTPRVMVYDAAASVPTVTAALIPPAISAPGYLASVFITENVDVRSAFFSVLYDTLFVTASDTLPVLLKQPTVAVNTFPGVPTTLQHTNVPFAEAISLPLALQRALDTTLANLMEQSRVSATAWNQTVGISDTVNAAPVVTAPARIQTPAAWTSFPAPTASPALTTAATVATLSATVVGATAIFSNPFTRVEFWALTAGGQYVLVGTASSATLVDNGATRVYTFSTTVTGAAVRPLVSGPIQAATSVVASRVLAIGFGASNSVGMVSAGPSAGWGITF